MYPTKHREQYLLICLNNELFSFVRTGTCMVAHDDAHMVRVCRHHYVIGDLTVERDDRDLCHQ